YPFLYIDVVMLLRSYHCPLVLSLLRFTLYSSCSVKIRGPSFVIAKVCSYCADLPVSCVRAVHPLSSLLLFHVPSLIIGSMVITIPSFIRIPLFGSPKGGICGGS